MQVTLEPRSKNAIQSYDNAQLTIDHIKYEASIIVSQETIITNWPVSACQQLSEETIEPILTLKPELIIIGHKDIGVQIPVTVLQHLSKLRIGIECMSIGAACRTFNILLSQDRFVVAGIILS